MGIDPTGERPSHAYGSGSRGGGGSSHRGLREKMEAPVLVGRVGFDSARRIMSMRHLALHHFFVATPAAKLGMIRKKMMHWECLTTCVKGN